MLCVCDHRVFVTSLDSKLPIPHRRWKGEKSYVAKGGKKKLDSSNRLRFKTPSQSAKPLTLRICWVKKGFEILGVWSTDTASYSFYSKG